MADVSLGFFARLSLAFGVFFRLLGDGVFAAQVARLGAGQTVAEPAKPEPAKPEAPKLNEPGPDAALVLLAMLQREARFIDFLEEDVAMFTDADIGAAARVVHAGARKVVREHFPVIAIRAEREGFPATVGPGFNPNAVKLTGNVAGEPPYNGKLRHKGWRVSSAKLPLLTEGHDPMILAPAEIEL